MLFDKLVKINHFEVFQIIIKRYFLQISLKVSSFNTHFKKQIEKYFRLFVIILIYVLQKNFLKRKIT